MRDPFSPTLLNLIQSQPGSATQAFATKMLEAWALLPSAQAEIDAEHNDRVSFRLDLINAALSVPE